MSQNHTLLVPTKPLINLPIGLTWRNEFDWSPVQQKQVRSVTGANLVHTGIKTKGRPLELSGGTNAGWVTRSELETLHAMLDENTAMVLTLWDNDRGANIVLNVKFDHGKTPIESEPIVDYEDMAYTDFYTMTLRFITI